MTEIFSDGFESGDFSAWTGTDIVWGSATVVSDVKHHGDYSGKFSVTAAGKSSAWAIAYYSHGNYTTVSARVYFKASALPPTSGKAAKIIFLRKLGYGTFHAGIKHDGTSAKFWCESENSGTVTDNYVSNPLPQINTWYCLEYYVVLGDNGEHRLYLDGVEKVTVTGVDNNNTITFINRLLIGNEEVTGGSSWLADIHVDCVVEADTYIGPEEEATLKEINDSVSLSELALGHKTFALTDVLGLSDATPLRDKNFSILDAASLSEQAPVTDRYLFVSEAVALTESLLADKSLTILDQTSLSDFTTANKIQEILDSVWLSEQILVELRVLAKIVAIKKAIINLLKTDATLQSLLFEDENGEYPVYHAYVQSEAHAPCVTVGDIADYGETSALGYGFDGSKRYEWRYALIQIDCWSNKGPAERDALQAAVEDCLARNPLDEALFASEESVLSLDEHGTKPPLWRKSLRFKVMYVLEA